MSQAQLNQTGVNHLELKPAGHYGELGMIFDVYIDGVCLLDNITEFEKRFHDRINGAYTAALGCEDIMHCMLPPDNSDPKEKYNKIKHDKSEPEGQRFMPYACDCGQWECWVFQGFITGYDDFIFWGQWRNPNRDDKSKKADGLYWNYKEFPTLCFDKSLYLAEIEKAQALVKTDKASLKVLGLYP